MDEWAKVASIVLYCDKNGNPSGVRVQMGKLDNSTPSGFAVLGEIGLSAENLWLKGAIKDQPSPEPPK